MSRHIIAKSLASAGRSSLAPRSVAALSSQTQLATRAYSLDGWGGQGGSSWQWPITKPNTIFNIVPQGYKYVVERFGKLHSIQDSGFFFAIPGVDQISYVIDIRERAMDIPPQAAITRDNVSVEVSGNLFIKFQDARAAAYGALNPLYSVTQVSSLLNQAQGSFCFRRYSPQVSVFFIILGYFRSYFYCRCDYHCCFSLFSMLNLPCVQLLEKWNWMRSCTDGLV